VTVILKVIIDSQENGTCATLVPLFNAKPEDLKTKDFQCNFLDAPSLKISDLLHSASEQKSFKHHLIFTILRIIITHGGETFTKFQKDLNRDQPCTKDKIKLHKTNLHPLPAWNIDESSITGNVEVDEAIIKELRLDTVTGGGPGGYWRDTALLCWGSALTGTISRYRNYSCWTRTWPSSIFWNNMASWPFSHKNGRHNWNAFYALGKAKYGRQKSRITLVPQHKTGPTSYHTHFTSFFSGVSRSHLRLPLCSSPSLPPSCC
jgi:hypothetical protein